MYLRIKISLKLVCEFALLIYCHIFRVIASFRAGYSLIPDTHKLRVNLVELYYIKPKISTILSLKIHLKTTGFYNISVYTLLYSIKLNSVNFPTGKRQKRNKKSSCQIQHGRYASSKNLVELCYIKPKKRFPSV